MTINSTSNYGNFILYELSLTRKLNSYKAILGFTDIEINILEKEMKTFLREDEILYFHSLVNKKTQEDYLRSRYISKHTIKKYTSTQELKSINLRHGIFNQPLLDDSNQISISHSGKYAASLVFSDEHPMGLDLEIVHKNASYSISSQLTPNEILLAEKTNENKNISLTRFWTAKEALSKVLKTGLTIPFHLLEIESIHVLQNHTACHFKHFTQYKCITYMADNLLLSIVLPSETSLNIFSSNNHPYNSLIK